jgi:hypothetical protein
MHFRLLVALLVGVLCSSAVRAAQAEEDVWTGIVIANNVVNPTPTPPELADIQDTLRRTFGYNQFRLIGQARKVVRKGDEDWMASSKYFSLHVDSKGRQDSGYLLDLQLFQEKKVLLETEARLSRRSPLVIRGPQVGDGQLLLLLLVQ